MRIEFLPGCRYNKGKWHASCLHQKTSKEDIIKKVFGQIGRLKRECIEEYVRRHEVDVYTEKWAGGLSMIRECNMLNYSIFIEDDVVFGNFEYVGEDYESGMVKMAADPVTQEWWKCTRLCFTKYSEEKDEPFYTDMKQIFSFDG